jgi:hypothetical protein
MTTAQSNRIASGQNRMQRRTYSSAVGNRRYSLYVPSCYTGAAVPLEG